MLVIGLTGGIGSGKTTVANLFADKGMTIIDTDQIARDLTQPNTLAFKHITQQFGQDVISPDDTLDRSRLRSIVFADPEKRTWLEQLLHPLIRDEVQKQIQSAQSPYCIVVIPLLFETEPNPLIQRVLVVDASVEQQIERAIKRDNTQQAQIESILKTQLPREKRLSLTDDVIKNSGSLDELTEQVNNLHQFYLTLAKRRS